MASLLDATTEEYSRTTGLPSISAFTIMSWFYAIDEQGNAPIVLFGNPAGASYEYYIENLTTRFSIGNGIIGSGGSLINFGTWRHLAITVSGTGVGQFLGYFDGVLDLTLNGNAAVPATSFNIGLAGANRNFRIAAVKIYGAALTQTEIASEMWQYVPVRWTNLNAWYPFLDTATDQNDFSANANTLTVAGTPTTIEGPPIPWNRYTNRKDSGGLSTTTGCGWFINSKGGWW